MKRLAQEVRRRLEPLERMVPVRLPGGPPAPRAAPPPAQEEAATNTAEDAAARIDAARARLRASIDPPAEDAGDER